MPIHSRNPHGNRVRACVTGCRSEWLSRSTALSNRTCEAKYIPQPLPLPLPCRLRASETQAGLCSTCRAERWTGGGRDLRAELQRMEGMRLVARDNHGDGAMRLARGQERDGSLCRKGRQRFGWWHGGRHYSSGFDRRWATVIFIYSPLLRHHCVDCGGCLTIVHHAGQHGLVKGGPGPVQVPPTTDVSHGWESLRSCIDH